MTEGRSFREKEEKTKHHTGKKNALQDLAALVLALCFGAGLLAPAFSESVTFFAGTFTNVYKPEQTETVLTVTKEVEDTAGTYAGIRAGDFAFVLTEYSDASFTQVKGEPQRAAVGAEKEVTGEAFCVHRAEASFAVSVSEAGERFFAVTEEAGDQRGITYADTKVRVRISAKDADGTLQVQTDWLDEPRIRNVYRPEGCLVTVEAKKRLVTEDGKQELSPAASAFTFILEDGGETDGAKGFQKLAEAVNDKDGRIRFAPVTLTKPGTYTLRVREVPGNDARITYDSTVLTVRVKAVDAGGYLQATALDGEEKVSQ